ncbi:expressed protein [Dictyostelium purpureum]|uniref:Expressed protein n=1 Tax=Dictyostelium purpureum TaxID=5786 RepID=F0ZQD2_DICPU|nr:uncharacterized protein DICPUDRAFT_92345 [Dictyostelium purpureum]EGC33842.1 expressed protein [Dictyostelium purpureum]|eukprot:XP_003289632.1 expressed protein [Dictyostelium purpureum]
MTIINSLQNLNSLDNKKYLKSTRSQQAAASNLDVNSLPQVGNNSVAMSAPEWVATRICGLG